MSEGIEFRTSLESIQPGAFDGFCVGWSKPLSDAALRKVLAASHSFIIAMEGGQVVGFITVISDGCYCAFIPLLEVRPEWQGRGIGTLLVQRVIADYRNLYCIDLVCDEDLVPYYERLDMMKFSGMGVRNRAAPILTS